MTSVRRCWTRLAKCAGRNLRSASFSSDRRRANISVRGKWCGNNVGGSLAFDGERILEWHILTKYFAGRLAAVDVFYSIHKAAIFNAEQLILGITASWYYVESLRLKAKFRFWLLRIRFYLTKLNLSSALPYMPRLVYEVHQYIVWRLESQWRKGLNLFILLIYYNLWHTITEANKCNAKESKTPYYSRTPKV